MSTCSVKFNCRESHQGGSKELSVPSIQILDIFYEQTSLMLAQILACPQVTLVLVEYVILASALISKKVNSFLEIGNFNRR